MPMMTMMTIFKRVSPQVKNRSDGHPSERFFPCLYTASSSCSQVYPPCSMLSQLVKRASNSTQVR